MEVYTCKSHPSKNGDLSMRRSSSHGSAAAATAEAPSERNDPAREWVPEHPGWSPCQEDDTQIQTCIYIYIHMYIYI